MIEINYYLCVCVHSNSILCIQSITYETLLSDAADSHRIKLLHIRNYQ
jgi:hypothetical protein